ncbi:MAG: prephenate dehydratase [Endomicrobiales bacterium]|nr:prephenate dehydratase [Endomicrobiales bacterium]
MDINELRKKIDGIDVKTLELLNERAGLAKKIGGIKSKSGKDFYSPGREKKVISDAVKRNAGPLPQSAVESIWREIVNACRSLESRLRIAYLGPEATFTHLAAIKNFGISADFVDVKSIADVFAEVERGRADFGVVPIENSTEGVINHTLDMFIESDLQICSELNMQIELCLISKSGKKSAIKKIYSHPQPLAQCRNWLEENLAGVPITEVSSTSVASKRAASEKNAAAIASSAAAVLYRLEVVEKGIEDSKENYTRFLIIGKNPAQASGEDKTSVMFSIKDKVGALHDILTSFKENGINLTKIESRPTKKKAWEYIFFVDFIGHVSDPGVQKALEKVKENCVFLKVLGSFPKAE